MIKKGLQFFLLDRNRLIALALGALMVAAHAPVGLVPVALVSLAGLFWLWQQVDTKKAAIQIGFWYGIGFFGVGVSWLISSIYIYAGVHLALSVLATTIFVLFLTSYFMVAGWLVAWLKRPNQLGINWVLLMPAVWVLAEALRASLFGGFPFLLTGNTHALTWLGGYAPVFGVLGVSWVVAISAGVLLWLVMSRSWVLAPMILAVFWLSGAALKNVEWVEADGKPVKVALIQGNIPQDQKWLQEQFLPTLQTYVSLTKQHLDADVVVWPETAIPDYYDRVEKGALRNFIRDAQLLNTDILVGVITRDIATKAYYNAIVNVHQPDQVYQKRHLVPFSEFFPFADLFKALSLLFDVPFSSFSAGADDQAPFQLGAHKVGMSVCYEMAFGEELAISAIQSDYLLTVSNDAWFAHTLEPAQQVQDVQMRALELGREIARTTNTGYTVIVGVDGQIKQSIEAYQTGVLRGEVQPYQGKTPFMTWRQLPVFALLALVLAVLVFNRWRSKSASRDDVKAAS